MKQPKVAVREGLWLLACVLSGLTLRLLALSRESAWGDEALTVACYPAASFGACLDCVFAEDSRLRLAPVFYWVQYAWSLVAGGDLESLRYLSVVLYVVACVQIHALGRLLGGASAGLWAAAFFSLSLFQVYYGQEVRFYALMNVLALAGLHGLARFVRQPSMRWLALCVAANAALVWTHTFAVVFVLSQGCFMLFQWKNRRALFQWFGCHAAMAAALAAWPALLGYDFAGQSAAYRDIPAGPRELANTVLQLAGGRFSNMDPAPYIAFGASLDVVIAGLVLALVALATFRALWPWHVASTTSGATRRDTALLWIAFAGPILGLFALTWLWRPCFFSRYVVYTALPLFVLAGIGMAGVKRAGIRHALAAAVLLAFAWQNLALPRPFRADYGGLARAVEADSAPRKTVLALKPFNHDAAVYALRDQNVPVELLHGFKETVGIAKARAAAGDSVWVVFYRWDDLAAFEELLAAAGFAVRQFTTAGMPPLTVFHVEERGR